MGEGCCQPQGLGRQTMRGGGSSGTSSRAGRARNSLRETPKVDGGREDGEVSGAPAETATAAVGNDAATGVVAADAALDAVSLIGAEAYLLEDKDHIQQQRQANLNIRALLGARKRGGATTRGRSADGQVHGEASRGFGASGQAAASAGAAEAGPPRKETDTVPPVPFPEFARLPDLPGSPRLPSYKPPLRPWQQEQHQHLLRLQYRQFAHHQGSQQAPLQGPHDPEWGPQPQRQRGETADTTAAAGASAIGAAGAAAAAAGADFFGRLHAECLAALRLLRPSEAEERKKREAAGRVRAVCRRLWGGCSVEVFGSSFTALGLPGSDLDVCVFTEGRPPLHDHYACSRCLCCSSSSNDTGSSSRCRGKNAPTPSNTCGAEAADRACCCTSSLSKHCKRSSSGSSSSSGCCCHGGPKGFQDLLRAADQQRDAGDRFSRQETVSKIREFAQCLRDINQAAAVAKRRDIRLEGGAGRFADCIETIVSARVPICKFRDAETGVAVDLSFEQPSAVLTSLYVRHKLKEFTLLHPLVLINKMLLRHWDLHEPFKGGVGSYLLFVMCLHFLQNNPHLRDEEKHRYFNLGHLLFQFFHYFGLQFNYESSAISVRGEGSLAPKSQGRWRSLSQARDKRMMLNAESPLDPSRDLGSSAYKIMQVRAAWRKAYLCLASRLMSEVRRGTQGKGDHAATSEPILSCVFGSATWPEVLEAEPLDKTISDTEAGVTTLRPGLWIPKELAAETERAVDGLAGSSVHLRRLPAGGGRRSKSSINTHANPNMSPDSDSSDGMRRRPWDRKTPLWASARQNMHVLFDSSESDSIPVRGFASSPSSSPRAIILRPAASAVASLTSLRQGTTPTTAEGAAAASTAATRTSKDVSSPPTLISVDDSNDSESSMIELRQNQARREANQRKRKRRKQRQAQERQERQKNKKRR